MRKHNNSHRKIAALAQEKKENENPAKGKFSKGIFLIKILFFLLSRDEKSAFITFVLPRPVKLFHEHQKLFFSSSVQAF